MRWIDVFRISFRMLRTNGLRSLLTILGIGVAISLIVILIGLGYGLQNITIGSIVQSKELLSLDIQTATNDAVPLTIASLDTVKRTAGIREASPVIETGGEIQINGKLGATAIVAAYPSYLEMQGVTADDIKGSPFTEGAAEIVVTPKVLELLDMSEVGVLGAKVTLHYTDPNNQNATKTIDTVTIVGIASPIETATVFTPHQLLDTNKAAKLTRIAAVAANRNDLVAAQTELQRKGYVVETLLDVLDQSRTIFRWVTVGLAVFGTIALIVAAIGMFNTLTISLMERTREIGIMKALGVSDRAVQRLFLTEAGMIGFGGGLAGIGLGLGIGTLLNTIMNQVAVRYGGVQIAVFQYPDWFLLSMLLYPIALALITGLYPAIRAARLNPLTALRYE